MKLSRVGTLAVDFWASTPRTSALENSPKDFDDRLPSDY